MPHHLSTSIPAFSPSPAARHYHPTLSIWLSVDPLSDKYPGVSPYTYCGNNPVRLVDEDGRTWESPEDQEYANSLIAKALEMQANYEKGSEEYNKLQEGINGLTYMGEVKEFKFTFTSENVDYSQCQKVTGNVSIEGNKFSINHLSSDNNLDLKDGTAWHEVVHLTRFLKQSPSYTIWSMKNWQPGEVIPESPNYGYKRGTVLSIIPSQSCPEEIYTYRSQFFFSPNSMVPNAIGNPIGIDDIPSYVEFHYKCQDK